MPIGSPLRYVKMAFTQHYLEQVQQLDYGSRLSGALHTYQYNGAGVEIVRIRKLTGLTALPLVVHFFDRLPLTMSQKFGRKMVTLTI